MVNAGCSSQAPSAQMEQPWVEKYRPKTLRDIVHQEELVRTLRSAIEENDVPHFLFHGPPGTGKTTAASAAVREIFGPKYRNYVLELNASDERGIQVVRNKISTFARASAGNTNLGCRIVILDEADSMTKAAQACLRRTMETSSARFFILCNYVSKIIDPLVSRCVKFRFKPLSADGMAGRIEHICNSEGVTLADDHVMPALHSVAGGDLRKAITTLQSAVRLQGTKVDSGTIYEVSGHIPDAVVAWFISQARQKGFSDVISAATDQRLSGYGAEQLIDQLASKIVNNSEIGEKEKTTIVIKLSESLGRLTDGGDDDLAKLDFMSVLLKELQC